MSLNVKEGFTSLNEHVQTLGGAFILSKDFVGLHNFFSNGSIASNNASLHFSEASMGASNNTLAGPPDPILEVASMALSLFATFLEFSLLDSVGEALDRKFSYCNTNPMSLVANCGLEMSISCGFTRLDNSNRIMTGSKLTFGAGTSLKLCSKFEDKVTSRALVVTHSP